MPNPRNAPKPPQEPDNYVTQDYRLDEKAEWGGFVNVPVSSDDKIAFTNWHETYPNLSAVILEELLGAGIKVTLAYDSENDSWLCSLTGRLVSDSVQRYVTTSRAGSMSEVIALACFKHVYIQRGVYQRYANNTKKLWG